MNPLMQAVEEEWSNLQGQHDAMRDESPSKTRKKQRTSESSVLNEPCLHNEYSPQQQSTPSKTVLVRLLERYSEGVRK